MAKPEWGNKRTCTSCAAKYYDFQRDPIVCPKCGEKFVAATTRPKRNRSARPEPVAEKPAVAAKDADPIAAEDEDVDDDDVDDDVILDDSDDLDDDLISVDAGDDSDEKEA
ncbi:MAG: TIGR02300 family protein [Alphaproteobacteria bacterium]|nr:TIGR02300 family protein [Alphaproteobacteria bacterium]